MERIIVGTIGVLMTGFIYWMVGEVGALSYLGGLMWIGQMKK